MQNEVKWFDRKFDLSFGMDKYAHLLYRLEQAPILCTQNLSTLSEEVQILKPNGKWSIKEIVGHLAILEALWQTRFQEIKEGKIEMSPADLNNTLTHEAGFNGHPLDELLRTFSAERKKTMEILEKLEQSDFSKTSIHPRLQQPMRIVDMMYFIAEHDQHHLDAIKMNSKALL